MRGIDRLPDELLIHILWLLPMKKAMSLSILSKKWYEMTRSLPCLCFDEKSSKETDIYRFKNFVDQVLLTHEGDVDKLIVRWQHDVDYNRLYNWIHYAISHNVRELQLELSNRYYKVYRRLPQRIFTCNTLELLRVHINNNFYSECFCKVPAKVCLPNLKTLYLNGLLKWEDNDDTSIQRLVSGCAMLEELEIDNCALKKNCDISLPKLKRLNIGYIEGESTIHIDAPNLVYFKCICFQEKFSVKNLNSLVEADLDFRRIDSFNEFFRDIIYRATIDLFKVISNVKSLQIYGNFDEILLRVGSLMPKLSKLTHLKIEGEFCKERERWVSILPQIFPYVEVLDLKLKHTFNKERVDLSETPLSSWLHLKNLKIVLFHRYESGYQLIEYLLSNTESLKNLTVQNISIRQLRQLKEEPNKWIKITRNKLKKLKEALGMECEITVL